MIKCPWTKHYSMASEERDGRYYSVPCVVFIDATGMPVAWMEWRHSFEYNGRISVPARWVGNFCADDTGLASGISPEDCMNDLWRRYLAGGGPK